MPRLARQVVADVPLHVTQRGNRGQAVFFDDSDRHFYRAVLHSSARQHEVEILAYCLMPNHVHLVLAPRRAECLQRVLRGVHSRHAQRINRKRNWNGHLWQGRFFSSMLDEGYLWSAIRYVERNPVRAGMIGRAEDYPWSSARAHCGLADDPLLSCDSRWARYLASMGEWSRWLDAGDDNAHIECLRDSARKGLPCGSPAFLESLEAATGGRLRHGMSGRPRRDAQPAAG